MGILRKLFGDGRPMYELGQQVTVFTPDNWKSDGTGGRPGEIQHLDYYRIRIIWSPPEGVPKIDEFYTRTGVGVHDSEMWFRAADQIEVDPSFSFNTPPAFGKEL